MLVLCTCEPPGPDLLKDPQTLGQLSFFQPEYFLMDSLRMMVVMGVGSGCHFPFFILKLSEGMRVGKGYDKAFYIKEKCFTLKKDEMLKVKATN